ncbi:MAG: hypothetical protein ABIH00_03325 [Armatimonadota bacterium]
MTENFEETSFPPHTRIITVCFMQDEKALSIELEDGSTHKVPVDDILSIHGARIRRESLHFTTEKKGGSALGSTALLAIGIPVNPLSKKTKEKATTTEDLQYVLGMRVKNVKEFWYLMASSFNFRKALGADAAYSLNINVQAFIQKLIAFCPQASRDNFFQAAMEKAALPKPVESLLEFLRSTEV